MFDCSTVSNKRQLIAVLLDKTVKKTLKAQVKNRLALFLFGPTLPHSSFSNLNRICLANS